LWSNADAIGAQEPTVFIFRDPRGPFDRSLPCENNVTVSKYILGKTANHSLRHERCVLIDPERPWANFADRNQRNPIAA